MIEFIAWPKTPRLFRDMIVTEKIDGTNAGIHIERIVADVDTADYGQKLVDDPAVVVFKNDTEPDVVWAVAAQSRKRMLAPGKLTDNFGFAAWVHEHAFALPALLGVGLHYGEWWGNGIQRGYGLPEGDKRFSLFNVHKYRALGVGEHHPTDTRTQVPGLGVVPLLRQHTFDTAVVDEIKRDLVENGSKAAPGFMKPEGVIVYHTAMRTTSKSLIENDMNPKGE